MSTNNKSTVINLDELLAGKQHGIKVAYYPIRYKGGHCTFSDSSKSVEESLDIANQIITHHFVHR